jgi:hypothetical protein
VFIAALAHTAVLHIMGRGGLMADKLNVTVDATNRKITAGFAVGALSQSVEIDLTDMKSVADGLVKVFSMSQEHLQGQIDGLAKRLAAVEGLLKDDLRHPADAAVRQL